MAKIKTSDALDVEGLTILPRCGTLPERWIPPDRQHDQRELLLIRMALRNLPTSFEHLIHAAIDRYGLQADGVSDLSGTKGRAYRANILKALPTRMSLSWRSIRRNIQVKESNRMPDLWT